MKADTYYRYTTLLNRHQCWIPTNVRISPRGFAVPCHRALDQLVINHNKYVLTFIYPQGEFTSCVVQQLPSSTQKTILSIMFVVILVLRVGVEPTCDQLPFLHLIRVSGYPSISRGDWD